MHAVLKHLETLAHKLIRVRQLMMRNALFLLSWHVWTQCNSQKMVLGLNLLDLLHVFQTEDEDNVFAGNVESLKINLHFQNFRVECDGKRCLVGLGVEHSQLPLLFNFLLALSLNQILLSDLFRQGSEIILLCLVGLHIHSL